jgi:hypothetical protein
MADKLFRKFVTLFKNWPIDHGKGERCLGAYMRKHFNKSFTKGELSENIDVKHWNKVLFDLKLISNDVYFARYPRKKGSLARGSLGLTKEVCRSILTDRSLKILAEKDPDQV